MTDALPSKQCFKCGQVKSLSEFYKHKAMADGHINKCKDCTKKDVTENREKRVEYYNAYDRVRTRDPERKAKRKITDAKPQNVERIKQYKKQYQYDTVRKAAAVAVNNAVRDCRLFKEPCFICGEVKVEAHHYDYSRPLDVSWLCKAHHMEIHRDHDAAIDEQLLATSEKGNRWDAYRE